MASLSSTFTNNEDFYSQLKRGGPSLLRKFLQGELFRKNRVTSCGDIIGFVISVQR